MFAPPRVPVNKGNVLGCLMTQSLREGPALASGAVRPAGADAEHALGEDWRPRRP